MPRVSQIERIASTRILCPVDEISGVWRFEKRAGTNSCCLSPPGHLLHFVKSGHARLSLNNKKYDIIPGMVIYYDSNDEVECFCQTDFVFYSVLFQSPGYKPFPPDLRVINEMDDLHNDFAGVEECFCRKDGLAAFHALTRILHVLESKRPSDPAESNGQRQWNSIIQYAKQSKNFHPDFRQVCRRMGISQATLLRYCRQYAGVTPFKYFKHYRMSEALALLKYSDMNITEIADYLKYPRINEFSREFSNYFGYPPSAARK